MRVGKATEDRLAFAPAGRDVYSQVIPFLCYLAPEERNRFARPGYRSPAGFRSYRSEIVLEYVRSYKHLAPLERKPNPLLRLEGEST